MTMQETFRSEFAHQARRVGTWLTLVTLVSVAFLLVRGGGEYSSARGLAFIFNSPFVVAIVTVSGGMIWLLVTTAFPGWSATWQLWAGRPPRTPASFADKVRALSGRFLAALALAALVLLAAPLGISLAILSLGVVNGNPGPFSPLAYVSAYAFIAVPSATVAAALQSVLVTLRGVGRQILVGAAVALAVIATVALVQFKAITDTGGRVRVEPFRIADNLYYVGTADVTAFLLTGPEGNVLIDGGYPGTASLIMENIATLGFDIADVKILLNSHAHFDHAGGLAALQAASGAELWVSEGDADIIASGGANDPTLGPLRLLVYAGLVRYPAPRVDHRLGDGSTIRLGPIELTAHLTAGHTPGCTTWSFPVRDGDRELRAVNICSLTLPPGVALSDPGLRGDFEHSFSTLRAIPADIFLASHASFFDLDRKLRERPNTANPVTPFSDRRGYLDYIDNAEAKFRKALAEQQQELDVRESGIGQTR